MSVFDDIHNLAEQAAANTAELEELNTSLNEIKVSLASLAKNVDRVVNHLLGANPGDAIGIKVTPGIPTTRSP